MDLNMLLIFMVLGNFRLRDCMGRFFHASDCNVVCVKASSPFFLDMEGGGYN